MVLWGIWLLFLFFSRRLSIPARWRTRFSSPNCNGEVRGVSYSSLDMTGSCSICYDGGEVPRFKKSYCVIDYVASEVFSSSICLPEHIGWENITFNYVHCTKESDHLYVIDTCELPVKTETFLEENTTIYLRYFNDHEKKPDPSCPEYHKRNYEFWVKDKCAFMHHPNEAQGNFTILSCKRDTVSGVAKMVKSTYERCLEDGSGENLLSLVEYEVGKCLRLPWNNASTRFEQPPRDFIVERCPITAVTQGRWRAIFTGDTCNAQVVGVLSSPYDMTGECVQSPDFPRSEEEETSYSFVSLWSRTTCSSHLLPDQITRRIYPTEHCEALQTWDNATLEYPQCSKRESDSNYVMDVCELGASVQTFLALNSSVAMTFYDDVDCGSAYNVEYWATRRCMDIRGDLSTLTCEKKISDDNEEEEEVVVLKWTTFAKCSADGKGEGELSSREFVVGQCSKLYPEASGVDYDVSSLIVERCPVTSVIAGRWRSHFVQDNCVGEVRGIEHSAIDMTGDCVSTPEYPSSTFYGEMKKWARTYCVDNVEPEETQVIRSEYADAECSPPVRKWNNASFEFSRCSASKSGDHLNLLDSCSLPSDSEKLILSNTSVRFKFYSGDSTANGEPICTTPINFEYWMKSKCAQIPSISTENFAVLSCQQRSAPHKPDLLRLSLYEECKEDGQGKHLIESELYPVHQCVNIRPDVNMIIEECPVKKKPDDKPSQVVQNIVISVVLIGAALILCLCAAAVLGTVYWMLAAKKRKMEGKGREKYTELTDEEEEKISIMSSHNMVVNYSK